jgi:F0F1-type ATP synthase assembly protein I
MTEIDKDSNGNDSNPNSEKNWMIQLGRYSHIGFALPAATLVGWGLGRLLAHWFHADWWQMVGLLIGIVAGFVEVVRTVMASNWNE